MWSAPHFRGRVMGIYTLLTLGSTIVGGPFIGWVCQQWSPRAGFAVAGVATLACAVLLSVRAQRDRAVTVTLDVQAAETAIDLV